MLLMTTLRTRAGRRSLPIDGTGQVLLGQAEFRRALLQERERSDRNSHGFAVVLLDVRSMDDAGFRNLTEVLARRMRRVDILGWYDRGRVGVILTDAGPDGARRFFEDIPPDLITREGRGVPARIFCHGPGLATLGPTPA